MLFDQGDPGELVYAVDQGAIDIVRDHDGREELLTKVVEGGYFGELAPTFGLRRSATARAAAPTAVTATRCATSVTGCDPAAWVTR